VLFVELVFRRAGRGIAAQPELLDEALSLSGQSSGGTQTSPWRSRRATELTKPRPWRINTPAIQNSATSCGLEDLAEIKLAGIL
jgi:hypothetical protein